jgi:anti-sigma B factor antagonist
MEQFHVNAVTGEGTCTLILTGEADLACAPQILELGLASLSGPQTSTLILDLGAITFIDSTAIGAFVALRNSAIETGKELVVTNVPARVLRIMTIAGLNTVFDIR